MKKYMMILMALYFLIVLSGCRNEHKEVAVLLYDLEDPFIQNVAERLVANDMTDYNITIYDSQRSQILQNELAEQLFEEDVDLLIINPVERLSSYIFIQKSIQEDVPIIFFNREPLREDLYLSDQIYYVGAKATESGNMQAAMVAERFGNNPEGLNFYDKNMDNRIQCVILKGEQGHQDAEERTTAVIDELTDLGYDVEVLVTRVANWNENEAYRDMKEIMDTYEDRIEVVISNNDAMAIGAVKFLYDHGYYGQEYEGSVTAIPFPIVGIDGLDEAKRYIEKGYMYGTIINDGDNMAKAILDLGVSIIEDGDESVAYELEDGKYIWIPYKNFSLE